MALKNVVFFLFVLACVLAYATAARTNDLNDANPAGLGDNGGQGFTDCLAQIGTLQQTCSSDFSKFFPPNPKIKFSAGCCSALGSVTSECLSAYFASLGFTTPPPLAVLQTVCPPPPPAAS